MKGLTRRNKYGTLYVVACGDISCRGGCTILSKVCHSRLGELSEWLKEHAWKACVRRTLYREFESLTLRHEICSALSSALIYSIRDSFQGRTVVSGSRAMEPREPRQARKGAAVNEPFHVPRGGLGAAARRWKGTCGHKGGGARN